MSTPNPRRDYERMEVEQVVESEDVKSPGSCASSDSNSESSTLVHTDSLENLKDGSGDEQREQQKIPEQEETKKPEDVKDDSPTKEMLLITPPEEGQLSPVFEIQKRKIGIMREIATCPMYTSALDDHQEQYVYTAMDRSSNYELKEPNESEHTYTCPEKKCTWASKSLNKTSRHCYEVHKYMPWYYCSKCNQRFMCR